jgi:hypothetical protein
MSEQIIQSVNDWLNEVVIGLNLCPFAAKPQRAKQIHLEVFNGKKDVELLEHVQNALLDLEALSSDKRETTVIIISDHLKSFDDYNAFLDYADRLLEQEDWEGIFQIASFHPDYQFAGTQQQDAENLTNRSPYPLLHLIREESLEEAISKYPNPENIPDTNIKRMQSLTEQEKATLFPYLFK